MKTTIWPALRAAVLIGAVTVAAIGQTSPPGRPYQGIVNGTDVHVRARAGLAAYPCTKVSYPTRVTVIESHGGWLKILPVAGTFSVVKKKYVRPDTTGTVGMVTEDNVWVRAGGNLQSQDFDVIQRRARKGTKVDIIGQTGDYYKISPPSGAYFWVAERYVTRINVPPVRSTLATSPVVATKPAVRVVGIPTTKEYVVRAVIKTTQSEAEVKAATAKFHAVDSLLKAEFGKPAGQRNLDPIVGKYEALRAIASGYLGPYIDARVQYIRAAIQREKDIKITSSLIEETQARHREYERGRAELVKPVPIATDAQPQYTARGILAQSALFSGERGVAKRYAIRGRHTKRIIGYAQCTTGDVDLSRYVGKEVGVVGTKRFESGIGLIIDVQQVTVMGEGTGMPLREAPTVIDRAPRLAPARIGPTPAPVTVPKPRPEITPRPLPIIEPLPRPKPAATKPRINVRPAATEPKPKVTPIVVPSPKPKGDLRPRPRPAVPKFTPTGNVDGVPIITPRRSPTTTPVPKRATKPTTRPTIRPVVPRALPPTGLPVIEPKGKGGSSVINEKEYE